MPNGYYQYETLQGDTFDMISLDFYGDEKYAKEIINANPDYRNILVFDAGISLKIPVIQQHASDTLPPWKR